MLRSLVGSEMCIRDRARLSPHVVMAASGFIFMMVTAQDQQSVIVTNGYDSTVQLWWMPPRPDGNPILQTTLARGGGTRLNSYEGHEFEVRSGQQVINGFTVTKGVRHVTLADGSPTCTTSTPRPRSTPGCIDRFDGCGRMVRGGLGCKESPGWMVHFCASSCAEWLNSCELSNPAIRCDRRSLFGLHNVSLEPAFQPGSGELTSFLEGLPSKWSEYGARMVSLDPPVVVLDSFLSEQEALSLRKAAGLQTFKRSTASGASDGSGYTQQDVTTSRTSTNAWCMHDCERDPTVVTINQRISRVTGVPVEHFEALQLLQYQPSQFYNRHHDHGGERNDANPAGPRVLTFFLYLSDVDNGGETEFTELKPPLQVKPKIGRAVTSP
eukprot:TRINITY_DN2291_c0_g1_i1.p1 TRINITY_DN2291_c0_g1~~TRINITY_DN2291_c0_g1_i1.p1  ORF type:complete len:382 (-),score=69.89 TRINITY_DN2291_c0_g1_i1:76-1221(-)